MPRSRYIQFDIESALLDSDSEGETDIEELVDGEAETAGWVDSVDEDGDTIYMVVDDDTEVVEPNGASKRKNRKIASKLR